MIRSHYIFTRDGNNPFGLLSNQRPSTDALKVLSQWKNRESNRRFKVIDNRNDESLEAELTWSDDDIFAGSQLDQLCQEFGICRHFHNRQP